MTATEPRTGDDTLSIRMALAADAAPLTAFARQAYAEHYGELWTPAGLAGWMQSNYGAAAIAAELGEPARVRYLLCERAGRLLGYAKVAPGRPVPTQPGVIGMELEKLYVARDATGSGVGGALIEHVLAFAHAAGHATTWLDVLRTNQGAVRLYRRCGFEIVGETPFATDRHDIGMFIMRRDTTA
jgi:ribosomal protein S18 acetylase RimI-like enzyme